MNIPISILLCMLFTMITGTIAYVFFVILCKGNRDTKVLKFRYVLLKIVIFAFLLPVYFGFEILSRLENDTWTNTIFGTTPFLTFFAFLVLSVWILGMILSLIPLLKNLNIYRTSLKLYETTTDYDGALFRMKARLGLTKTICVRKGDYYESPFCTGIVRPAICLPNLVYSKEELDYIFMHELIHHKHKDLWMLGIIQVLSVIYWFHPVVRKNRLLLQYRELMEDACDIDVCRQTEDDKRYISVLLRMSLKIVESRKEIPVFLSESYEDVLRRIANMEKYKSQKPMKRVLVTSLVATVFCGSSLVVYAAECGVVAGYEKVYDATWQGVEEEINGNTENTLEEVYELAVMDENIAIEYADEDVSVCSSVFYVDYTISGNTEKRKSSSHALSSGDKVIVSLTVAPTDKNVKVGFYMSNGYVRYITGSGNIYHTFTIYDDDRYTFFVQNNNSTTVEVGGYYSIQ